MLKNMFYCARFYVTYRCNSKCVYCNVWRNKKFQNIPEMNLEKAKILIKQCYEQGVRYIDFTGGEPTLCPYLPDMIRYAKSLGIKTEVTSNCVSDLSKSKMMIVASEVDKFNISLDTLKDNVYHRVRGVNSCSTVKKAVQDIALIRSPKIMTVITDDNVAEINDMIEYATKNKAQIYLSPMFPYIDKDGNYCVSQHVSKIVECIFKPYTVVLLHFMLFFQEASLQKLPPCSANLHTLTFSPAGNLVIPC